MTEGRLSSMDFAALMDQFKGVFRAIYELIKYVFKQETGWDGE